MASRPRSKTRKVSKNLLSRSGLSAQQEQATVLLSNGMRVGKVAEEVGVTGRTIWEWMQIPAFQDECKRIRDEVSRAAREHIQANLLRAAETVEAALLAVKPLYLKDGDGFAPTEDVPDQQARLRAAFDMLDRAGIPRRVEALTDDPYKALVAALTRANEANAKRDA